MNEPKSQSTSIQVMSRMFALLDTLAQGQEAVSLKHISAQTGLHPSTAHRILNDLAAGRYVERAGPGSYRLGLRLLELGNLVRSRLDLKEESLKPMLELHRLTGLSVSLHARQDHESVCLARTMQERHGVTMQRVTTGRAPLTDTLPGRTMLIKDSLAQVNHLCQLQGHRPEAVALDLQQLRQSGVLTGTDDTHAGGAPCVCAPVFNDAGQVIGSLSVTGTSVVDVSAALQNTTSRISALMGWPVADQA
ncbi:MAG TPA: helix-turn-helix domain-containing protein [Aquabacterium sp.]|uniref:IclR family transcriptional regulator n=1 Tax=Aquabacterium sp. TaxID=1872578 RepID=UPI002E2F1FAE|nr:helix-turn-helix domain-containing protein [Aquabacterium sp.]HEX5371172.1 helix-turn-helix domain-containing protein [Aquabacterium sp.]